MALSDHAKQVLEATPAEVREAWAAAFRWERVSDCTPEQKQIIADWVTDRVMNCPLPNAIPGEIWPPSFGRERREQHDMFRR